MMTMPELTARQSADLKMALKHDPETPELVELTRTHPLEFDEACTDVEERRDRCHPDSIVAKALRP